MQIGIDSFAAAISDPATGLTLSPAERMHHLLEEIKISLVFRTAGSETRNLLNRCYGSPAGCQHN